jgi:hypothetical protein
LEGLSPETLLYRNPRNGRFADITESAGPGFAPCRQSSGLAIGDPDGGGRPEIAIVNMNDKPTLLQNLAAAECDRDYVDGDAVEPQRDRRALLA